MSADARLLSTRRISQYVIINQNQALNVKWNSKIGYEYAYQRLRFLADLQYHHHRARYLMQKRGYIEQI